MTAKLPPFIENIRLSIWQTPARLYPTFINWSSSCESSAFHLPPCKPSGRHQFRRWCHGSPGSGIRSHTAPLDPGHWGRQVQHSLLLGLERRRQAMTHVSKYVLILPNQRAFPCHMYRRAACCGSFVNQMQTFGLIARDEWSSQGEWPMSALNLTAWHCKRRTLWRIDGFSSVGPNRSAFSQRNRTSLPATCVVPWH